MPRNRSEWKYVVDPEYAEQVCSMSWCQSRGGYLRHSKWGGGRAWSIPMHRLVWELAHGTPIPEGLVIDHINRVPWDNRVANLRLTTPKGNSLNCRQPGRDGLPHGVWKRPGKRTRPYRAQIKVDGRIKYLGSFATPEEASASYERARGEAIAAEEQRATTAGGDKSLAGRGGSPEGNRHTNGVG
jgi:hypothetical protein